MRQELTLEEYTNYRRQYIDEAKRACHAGKHVEIQQKQETGQTEFSFGKLRFLLAMLLLTGFLYCRYTDVRIFAHTTDDIIKLTEEQQFPQMEHWMNQITDYLRHLK